MIALAVLLMIATLLLVLIAEWGRRRGQRHTESMHARMFS